MHICMSCHVVYLYIIIMNDVSSEVSTRCRCDRYVQLIVSTALVAKLIVFAVREVDLKSRRRHLRLDAAMIFSTTECETNAASGSAPSLPVEDVHILYTLYTYTIQCK